MDTCFNTQKTSPNDLKLMSSFQDLFFTFKKERMSREQGRGTGDRLPAEPSAGQDPTTLRTMSWHRIKSQTLHWPSQPGAPVKEVLNKGVRMTARWADPPTSFNKVLLQHSPIHSPLPCLWALSSQSSGAVQLRRKPHAYEASPLLLCGPGRQTSDLWFRAVGLTPELDSESLEVC